MRDAGVLASRHGKARLLTPEDLPADWDPTQDTRKPAWEVVHHLVRDDLRSWQDPAWRQRVEQIRAWSDGLLDALVGRLTDPTNVPIQET